MARLPIREASSRLGQDLAELPTQETRHPILRRGTNEDAVEGAYLELNDAELQATDRYEVADYARRVVVLASGVEAFVYVADGE